MRNWRAVLVAASLALACMGSGGAIAGDVRVSGTVEKLVLHATDASLTDILSGLQVALHMRIRLSGSTGRYFTGTYKGSLRRLLARLLDGTDYVVNTVPEGLRIAIVGASGTRAVSADEATDEIASNALAVAAAGNEASREYRLRQQRVLMRSPSAQDSE